MWVVRGAMIVVQHVSSKCNAYVCAWGWIRKSPSMTLAVARFRMKLSKELSVCVPWEETNAQWTARARQVVAFLNKNYHVDRLCQQFPQRLEACRNSEGE